MKLFNGLHRQQLFHWIGWHIDHPDPQQPEVRTAKLNDEQRREYVKCLAGALEHGLWLNTPRDPDQLGHGEFVKVTRPIACFTEWALGESLPHTLRYGRLGLGFSKKFVLEHGGQPVTYVRDRKSGDPFTRSLLTLARLLQTEATVAQLPPARLAVMRAGLDYLSHFVKRIRSPRKRAATPRLKLAAQPKRPTPQAAPVIRFERDFGATMQFLEEREWRIVHDASLARQFTPGPGRPAYYLRFQPGAELFTLVLPDNRTVNLALNTTELERKLFPKDAPHVTVLSLQDVGTF